MHVYLAIDVGTAGGRHVAAWLEDGRIMTRELYRFPNGAKMKNGRLCWDIAALEAHVVAGLKAARAQGFTPVSIGIDAWASDFVLLDAAGQLLDDAMACQDDRTHGMDALLEESLPLVFHYGLCGVAKRPSNTVYQMMALLREHPEYAEAAEDFLLIPEYLAYALTGQKAHEWTGISSSALCNAATGTWSETILTAAGLPEKWFRTPIRQPGRLLGRFRPEIAAETGFDAPVLLVATHDAASASMAIPAQKEDAAFLFTGTPHHLGTELPVPVLSSAALAGGFTNEGGYGHSTRFLKPVAEPASCPDALREMSSLTGKSFTGIHLLGDGSGDVMLSQQVADATGLPVYASPAPSAALGNLAAQMIADGAFGDLAAFRAALPESFEIQTYWPKG